MGIILLNKKQQKINKSGQIVFESMLFITKLNLISTTMISVIIPTYNRLFFLKKAVKSVLSQSYRDLELIVMDDGSDDGTEKWIQSIRDERIRYFYQENRGVSSARNQGILKSKGGVIAFLDSDDFWKETKLERQLRFMQKNFCSISHTQEIWYRRGIILNQKKKHRKYSDNLFKKSLDICSISISTIMMQKSLFDSVGLFDESLPACEDYDMWLRMTSRYPVLLFNEELTEKDGGRPDQLSRRIPMLDRFRIIAIRKLLKSDSLNREQTVLALNALQKKCRVYINGCRKHGREEEAAKYEGFLKGTLDKYNGR